MRISKFEFRVLPPVVYAPMYEYYNVMDKEEGSYLVTAQTMEVMITMEVNGRTYGNRQIIRRSDIESHMEQLIRAAYTNFREAIENEQ